MDTTSFRYILEQPNENGIVVFILGILFILSIYHFLLYFQHKDNIYLYYSFYTSLIFLSHLNDVQNGFLATLSKPVIDLLNFIDLPLMWLYNIIYFVFGFTFVDLKSYSKKWHLFLYKTIFLLLLIVFTSTIVAVSTNNITILDKVNTYIIAFLFLFGPVCYYPLLKFKMPLQYYIVIGSLVLFISSLVAFYIHRFNILPEDSHLSFSIFYIGMIIENIIFTLGLGHKQKLILQEKNDSQQKLIFQLKENENLKIEIQKKLEEDIASFSKQAEKEKFEKLKANYDKELAELKVSSLRSQMNPHFIFNSLNAIKLYIIESEKENAVYYLNKFSKLIRKILASTREKEITLADEIETLKLYFEIENIRFNNEIIPSLTIAESLNVNTIKIPSLILQPFLENAIWHGLSSKKGTKKIDVSFEKEKETHLKITIIDNGIGRKKSTEIKSRKIHKKESIGIKLTQERLTNFSKDYKNNYSLHFIDLLNKNKTAIGTEVVLRIPLK